MKEISKLFGLESKQHGVCFTLVLRQGLAMQPKLSSDSSFWCSSCLRDLSTGITGKYPYTQHNRANVNGRAISQGGEVELCREYLQGIKGKQEVSIKRKSTSGDCEAARSTLTRTELDRCQQLNTREDSKQ
jgi:hypothetical protein